MSERRRDDEAMQGAFASERPHIKIPKHGSIITNNGPSEHRKSKSRNKESNKARHERRKRQAMRTKNPAPSPRNKRKDHRPPPLPLSLEKTRSNAKPTTTAQPPGKETTQNLITILQEQITSLEESLEEVDTALRLAAPATLLAHRERAAALSALEEKETQVSRLNSQLRSLLSPAATGSHPQLSVALEAQAQQHLLLVRGLQDGIAERDAKIAVLEQGRMEMEGRMERVLELHRGRVREYEARVWEAEGKVEAVRREGGERIGELRGLLEEQQGLIGRLLMREEEGGGGVVG